MFAPSSHFADLGFLSRPEIGPVMGGHERDHFDLPVNNPMLLDNHSQNVVNTFCKAFRSASHLEGPQAFQDALDKTLIEHALPRQQSSRFTEVDIMDTLVDAGLRMPSRFLPEHLKGFGSDVINGPEQSSAFGKSQTQFDPEALLAAHLIFEGKRKQEAEQARAVPRKEPEVEMRELELQREEMRAIRARQMGAPRPVMVAS